MIGIPYMLAFAMRADGWYWRRAIVWMKAVSFCKGYSGSTMPESATDRPTASYEIIHLFSKKKDYVYDWFEAREDAEWNRWGAQKSDKMVGKAGLAKDRSLAEINAVLNTGSRNWRDVWALKRGGGTKFKHYAAFPLDLPLKCITAGTMPFVCAECGAPWERVILAEKQRISISPRWAGCPLRNDSDDERNSTTNTAIGWQSTCNHPCRTPARSVVLDPFGGTGTTAQAAEMLGRDSILIDLGSEYCDMAKERMATPWKASPGGRKKESKLKPLF